MKNAPPLISLAILAFNAILSSALFITWRDAPVEKWSALVFLIWIFPIFVYWLKYRDNSFIQKTSNTVLLGLSLIFAFLSIVGSINALAYMGLALALTALVPFTWGHLVWILTSASWMPALGWFYTRLFPSFSAYWLLGGRVAIALAGTLTMICVFKCKKEQLYG